MELVDYLNALRRFWRVWVGITLLGLVLGLVAFAVTPRSYQATARIFVSVQPTIPNGAQYVESRVQSYPAVVTSATVLAPVIRDMGLDESVSTLAGAVSVNVPAGTSELDISVSDRSARDAADIANSVAQATTQALQQLETPAAGARPVTLTVTDPAAAPASPSSPRLLYDLTLGLVAGLLLGLASAVVRSRTSRVLHDERDVRRAWGAETPLDVIGPPHGRARRSTLTGDPATVLARRLELLGPEGPARFVLLSPAPSGTTAVQALAERLAAELARQGTEAAVTDAEGASIPASVGRRGVRLVVADPMASSRFWREVADDYDGVVLVVPSGRVSSAELSETQAVLHAAGVTTLAVVLTPRGPRRGKDRADTVAGTEGAPAVDRLPTAIATRAGSQSADERVGDKRAWSDDETVSASPASS